jgi:hypothetical protein
MEAVIAVGRHRQTLKTHIRMKHIVLANELISKGLTDTDEIPCLILALRVNGIYRDRRLKCVV